MVTALAALLPLPVLTVVLIPVLLTAFSAFGTSIEAHIFSWGLSLPSDTGRGLSEQGDASRDTLSESSSDRICPAERDVHVDAIRERCSQLSIIVRDSGIMVVGE